MDHDLYNDITSQLMNGKTMEDLKILSVKTRNHQLFAHLLREADFYTVYYTQLSCIRRKIKVEEGADALDTYPAKNSIAEPIFSKSQNINTMQNLQNNPPELNAKSTSPSRKEIKTKSRKTKPVSEKKLSKKKAVPDKKIKKITAHQIYVKETLPQIKKTFPNGKGADNFRKVNAMWKALDSKTKKIYEDLAKQENKKEVNQIPVANGFIEGPFLTKNEKIEGVKNMKSEIRPFVDRNNKPKDLVEKSIKYEIIADDE